MTAGRTATSTGDPLQRLDAEQRALATLEGLCTEVRTACDRFFRSRGMPERLTPSPAINIILAMNNRQIAHQGKPAPGPRRWRSKARESTPAPSMKPDWQAIVREAEKQGLVHRSKREP